MNETNFIADVMNVSDTREMEHITAEYWTTHEKTSDIAKYRFNQKVIKEKKIALACGLIFVACLLTIAIAELFFPVGDIDATQKYAVVDGKYYEIDVT